MAEPASPPATGPVEPAGAAEPSWPSWRRTLANPAVLQRLSVVSLAMVVLIVLTGASVRLTGSGLGCSDWPTCSSGHLTPALQFHGLIEFSNRMVSVVLTIVVGVTFVVSWLRRPRRTDLIWLSGGLVVGVLAQAVLGGIVVYTHLNPYLVMIHFLASSALVVDAVVLVHRGRRDYSPGAGRALVGRPIVLAGRGLLALLAVVLLAGSATTGAGPHAGDASGQEVAKRIPVALRQMAELHSSLALLLVGVTVGLVLALHAIDVPERVRRAGRILVVVLMVQAAIGYTQYFTHLPALLVELHVAGATALVVGFTQFFLALTYHPLEAAAHAAARVRGAAPVTGVTSASPEGAPVGG